MSKGTVIIKAKDDDHSCGYKKGDMFEASIHGSFCRFIDNDGDSRLKNMEGFYIVVSATPSPVRTVTRKEIVPGKYGPVVIGGNGSVLLPQACYTPDELREAAHILNQIAEALEDV